MPATRHDPPTDRARVRRRVGGATSDRDRIDAWWIVAFSAVAAGFAGTQPAGWRPADIALTAAFGGLVSLAGSRARRWTWVWTAGIAFAAAGGGALWVALGLTAFGLALACTVLERRGHTLGAIVGALAVQSLLHLPGDWFQGATALIAAAAVLPMLVSGYRRARRHERRLARRIALGVGAVVVLVCSAYAVAGVLARPNLESGVDDARAALDLIRDGETDQAAVLLADASESFDKAESLLAGPLGLPARAVPIIGHHASATAEMTTAGAQLSAVAERTSTTARYDQVAASAGFISLTELSRLQQPVLESRDALRHADEALQGLDSAWLIPPVADPLSELRIEVTDALDEATLAHDALEIAPTLLGINGPQRYLVLLGQPAESRYGGGFVGTWAELTATNGQIDLTESGTIEDLRNAPGFRDRRLSGPPEFLVRYGRYFPEYNIQNVTATPDFPTTRQVIDELYPKAGGSELAGAMYLDPNGVAALLELSGPVEVEGLDRPLRADTAEEFLVQGIYEQFPVTEERDEVLRNSIDAVFDALTSQDLPGPRTMADVMSPAVRGGHLSFSVEDQSAEAFLGSVDLTGRFPRFDEGSDLLAVKTANAAPNKIDTYVNRTVEYEVELDPSTGSVDATVRVTLANDAPGSGLPEEVGTNRALLKEVADAPPPGTAILNLAVWTPLDLEGATTNGDDAAVEPQQEFTRHVYTTRVEIEPGAVTTVVFHLSGVVDVPYRLVIDHQPLAEPDAVRVHLSTTDGREAQDIEGFERRGKELVLDADQREDLRFFADFASNDG